MPFDGANFSLSTQDVLDAAMAASGLEAIDPSVLDRHMADQLRRHPASWAYRNQQPIALAQVAVLLASVGLFVGLLSSHQIAWGIAAGLLMFGFATSPLFLAVKGPAIWRERMAADLRDAPAVVRDAAARLQRRLPGVGFIEGELYQERVRLDPYLVAEYGDARVVLAIWDDGRVIACA